jgi:hypothetical protein
MDNYKNWTIIYYFNSQVHKPIHSEHIIKSNPRANVIIADIFDEEVINSYSRDPSVLSWRNCDKLLREWLKKNIHKIKSQKVALLEWDVLFTKELPSDLDLKNKFFSKDLKIYRAPKETAKSRFYEDEMQWRWFFEKHKLGRFEQYACGVPIMGCLLTDVSFLRSLIDDEFEPLYKEDIFCELRIGTIMNYKHMTWVPLFFMPNIVVRLCNLNSSPGFYHPVKAFHKVSMDLNLGPR